MNASAAAVAPHRAVEMQNITKRFGDKTANDDISLTFYKGAIHGLIGENGAGKSTVMKILYGQHQPDSGEIHIAGKRVEMTNPDVAISFGIGMVHQHFMLVDALTVWENIILGVEPCKAFGIIDTREAAKKIQKIFNLLEIDLSVDRKIADLSVGEKQLIELVKLLYRETDFLILDEPTAVLTPHETEKLFEILRRLQAQGKTVVIITHKLPEVMSITNYVSVLRGGKKIQDYRTHDTHQGELVIAMIGKPIENIYGRKPFSNNERRTALKLKNVSYFPSPSEPAKLDNVSLELKRHEILGIAGVSGNGQTELEWILSRQVQPSEGSLEIKVATSAHIPEDRQHSGLIMDWSVSENILLGHQRKRRFLRGGFLSKQKITAAAETLMHAYHVQPPDVRLKLSSFSGGNQQKIILARELHEKPEFILVSHPTRGVDIGAIQFIHKTLLELRDSGSAILLITADLEELLNLSDRILVLCKGKIMGELDREAADEKTLGLMMSGSLKKERE